MLPFGHAASGYLIAKTSREKLSPKATGLIIAAANIFDLDFFIFGASHHGNFTHTPFMGLIYWLLYYCLFRKKFQLEFFLFVGLALLGHLIFDDFSYWLSLIGWEKPVIQQINWLFPFTPLISKNYSVAEALRNYLIISPKLFYLEIIFVISALVLFFHDKINGHVKE